MSYNPIIVIDPIPMILALGKAQVFSPDLFNPADGSYDIANSTNGTNEAATWKHNQVYGASGYGSPIGSSATSVRYVNFDTSRPPSAPLEPMPSATMTVTIVADGTVTGGWPALAGYLSVRGPRQWGVVLTADQWAPYKSGNSLIISIPNMPIGTYLIGADFSWIGTAMDPCGTPIAHFVCGGSLTPGVSAVFTKFTGQPTTITLSENPQPGWTSVGTP